MAYIGIINERAQNLWVRLVFFVQNNYLMQHVVRKYKLPLSLFFMLIAQGMFYNTSVNMHTHIVDGRIITHAHPNTGASHAGRTVGSLLTLEFLTVSLATAEHYSPEIPTPHSLVYLLQISPISRINVGFFHQYFLRGPPSLV